MSIRNTRARSVIQDSRDVAECGREAVVCQRGDRMEDDRAVRLPLEGAVARERTQMDQKPSVPARSLDDGDDARVQMLDGGQAALLLGAPPSVPHDAMVEAAPDEPSASAS